MGGPATYFVAILPSFLAPRGSAVAVGCRVEGLEVDYAPPHGGPPREPRGGVIDQRSEGKGRRGGGHGVIYLSGRSLTRSPRLPLPTTT